MKKQNIITKVFTCFLVAVMIICSLTISSVTSIEAEAADTLPFKDISSYGWAKDGIQYVYDQGMMTGTTKTTFDPAGNLLRGDAIILLWRLAGKPDVGITGSYSDVKSNAYYSKAIEWAKATGVYNGYSDGTFKPTSNITRQDFGVMLMNTCNYLTRHSVPGDKEAYKVVKDYNKVSDYAVPAIQWCYSNKIMGQGSNFNPSSPITRAETAVMIKRMLINTDTKDDDVYSFLCMGIDYNNYADANILVSINKTDKTITLTSILRDMKIDFASLGFLKFNNAFRYGSGELMVKTIEKYFGVKVDNYAYVHFDQMAEIFDMIDGLNIDVTLDEAEIANAYTNEMYGHYNFNGNKPLITKGGMQHLEGYQLVGFCRVRYVGRGDIERTQRQRTVFSAMFEKLKTFTYPELLSFFMKAMPKITHNMSITDFMKLVTMFPTLRTYELILNRVPQDGNLVTSVDEDYMLVDIDFAAASALMKKMIYNN